MFTRCRPLLVVALTSALAGCGGLMNVGTADVTSFSVPRYTNYPSLTAVVHNESSQYELRGLTITATCHNHTYESLETEFAGSNLADIPPGGTAEVAVPYSSGYPSFIDLRVLCDFEIQDGRGLYW